MLYQYHHFVFQNTGPECWMWQRRVYWLWISWLGCEDSWSIHISKAANPGDKGLRPKVKENIISWSGPVNTFRIMVWGLSIEDKFPVVLRTLKFQGPSLCTDSERSPKYVFLWPCVFTKLVKYFNYHGYRLPPLSTLLCPPSCWEAM